MKKVHANFHRLGSALAALLITLGSKGLVAQTSLFQDYKGESAYKVLGSVVTVNPADGNISANCDVSYRRVKGPDSATKFRRMGFFAQMSSNEGVVNLKSAKGFPVDGEIGFYYGQTHTSDILDPDVWVHSMYVSGNAIIDRTQVYDISGPTATDIFTKVFPGWKLEAAYNGFKGNLIWGVSFNGGQKTNIDYLSAQTITILQKPINATTAVWDEFKAYNGEEFQGNLVYANGNVDFAYLLNRKMVTRPGRQLPPIYLAAIIRYACLQHEMPLLNPGLGVYLSKVGAPQEVVLGLSAQLQDVFEVYETTLSPWQRTTLNLTVGYKFAQ